MSSDVDQMAAQVLGSRAENGPAGEELESPFPAPVVIHHTGQLWRRRRSVPNHQPTSQVPNKLVTELIFPIHFP
jgi:hypothetical protein